MKKFEIDYYVDQLAQLEKLGKEESNVYSVNHEDEVNEESKEVSEL